MATFEWKKEYETGIMMIDFQHQKLVSLINDFSEAVEQGHLQLVVDFSLDQLCDYTVFHFDTEERLMKEAHYPDFEAHKKMHEALKKKVLFFKEKVQAGDLSIVGDVLEFLKTWLTEHIQEKDMDYVQIIIKAMPHLTAEQMVS